MNNSIGDDKTAMPTDEAGGHAYALRVGETLGQYRVIKPLGTGGMGEVYLVEHAMR